MVGAAEAHHADAVLPGALDCQQRRLPAHRLPEPTLALRVLPVDGEHRPAVTAARDGDALVGNEVAAVNAVDVGGEHLHAVAVVAREVTQDQVVGHHGLLLGLAARRVQHASHNRAQRLRRDAEVALLELVAIAGAGLGELAPKGAQPARGGSVHAAVVAGTGGVLPGAACDARGCGRLPSTPPHPSAAAVPPS